MINDNDFSQDAQVDYENQINNLENKYGKGFCNHSDIESMAQDMLDTIPRLNRDQLREEMNNMHVDIYLDPTTFNINEGLAKSQAYRERLCGILALADREYNTRSKVFEMLQMAHNVVSKASSADRRKGEALLKYSIHFINLEAAETFKDEVAMFLKNMQSTSETISRQASVLQAQITLGEIRRKDDTFTTADNFKPVEELRWK